MRLPASFSRRAFSCILVAMLAAWATCGTARAAVTATGDVLPNPIDPLETEDISVGDNGVGSLRIDAGSMLESYSVAVGREGVGYATVTGASTRWMTGDFAVGEYNGVGRLDVTDGAVLTSDSDMRIGSYNGAGATVVVDGVGSTLWTGGYMEIGAYSPGTLRVGDGAVVLSANGQIDVGGAGRLELEGGLLSAGEFNNAGVLTGSGQVNVQYQFTNYGRIEVGPGEKLVAYSSEQSFRNYSEIRIVGGEAEFLGQFHNVRQRSDGAVPEVALIDGVLRLGDNSEVDYGFYHTTSLLGSYGGTNDVYGSMIQRVGRTLVTGDSTLMFHDFVDVVSGSLDVHAGSTVMFLAGAELGGVVNLTIAPGAPLPVQIVDDAERWGFDYFSLHVDFAEAVAPQVGDVFPLMSGCNLLEGIGETELPELPFGMVWSVDQSPSSLQLRILATPKGDYNGDGTVDSADYTVWRDSLGSSTLLSADGDGNGQVDPGDYVLWKSNFGADAWSLDEEAVAQAALAAVPEPAAGLLVLIGAVLVALRRRS